MDIYVTTGNYLPELSLKFFLTAKQPLQITLSASCYLHKNRTAVILSSQYQLCCCVLTAILSAVEADLYILPAAL